MKPKILVVEDETHLMELLLLNLDSEGYECTPAKNGKMALELLLQNLYDLVLLDVMLPGMNGFEVMDQLMAKNIETPVIFLTARSDDKDKISGLRRGAVDYISKPFNLEELLLRINIHLKAASKKTLRHKSIVVGDFEVNPETFEVSHKGVKTAEIGKKELLLLQLLAEQSGKVVSRETILSRIWGNEVETTTRTIDNYILTLRKLFNDDPKNPRYLHSIRGVGYKLTN